MTGPSSWSQTVAVTLSQLLSHLRTQRIPWKSCWSVAAVGVVWSVCQVEAPEHSSVRCLLFLCLLWMLLAAGAHVLKWHLQQRLRKVEPVQEIQQVYNYYLRSSQWSRPGRHAPLALVLANSLLLCVLQEPLADPTVVHIQALLGSLQLVSQTLEAADTEAEETEDVEDVSLTEKVRLLYTYLQQRVLLLSDLVDVQSSLESSVSEVHQGLAGLWAQLEEQHTGVTLTKKGVQGSRELPSAQADVKIMLTEVDQYRNKLQRCQSHLKDTIRVLQELTWSHANVSQSVNSCIESVWPEKLLQANIEQFDKLQEGFQSLEQQTLTFQAHLEGLGKDSEESETSSCTSHLQNEQLSDTSSMSMSSADALDVDEDEDNRQSLCERSALPFTTTIGRLRMSRRRK